MAAKIRVLDSANRTMQRLGYLKLLCARSATFETSNLATLGNYLLETISKRVRIGPPLPEDVRDYVRARLTDSAYRDLRKQVLKDNGSSGPFAIEIQDVYLANPSLPSRTGKLVKQNWRRYPYLATSLDLIKKGTYSALTRSLVLLNLTPKEELEAFERLDSSANPLRISREQSLLFLYCFIDNDAEVLFPFMSQLLNWNGSSIPEKDAGQLLPEIIRNAEKKHSTRLLPREDRDRLATLRKVADSIEAWKERHDTGGGALRENVSVRLEPFCDLGLLTKPDRDRYEYRVTPQLKTLINQWRSVEDTEPFLETRFFSTVACCWNSQAVGANEQEATDALILAHDALKSPLGYSPITDLGLLAGIRLLAQKSRILELNQTTDLLKMLQKEDPNMVRFTVDRMGRTAYVKFLKPTAKQA